MNYSLKATALVYPMFAMVLVTLCALGALLHSRLLGFKSGKISGRYFKSLQDGEPTPYMINSARHVTNLFEIPVLFYAGCATAIALHMEHQWLQIWAWVFVVARALQAIIHIGPNKIVPRFISFATGVMAVIAFWITLILKI